MSNAPAPDEDDDVENAGDDEKVAGKDQLMMEPMSDDAENDGQRQRNSP